MNGEIHACDLHDAGALAKFAEVYNAGSGLEAFCGEFEPQVTSNRKGKKFAKRIQAMELGGMKRQEAFGGRRRRVIQPHFGRS